MNECPKLQKCPFFNNKMSKMPSMAEMFKTKYCKGEFEKCGRYIVAESGIQVPVDLYPQNIERAKKIINE